MKPQDIEWPRDVTGMSVDLRRAIIKAVARANGREDKSQVLLETLRAGAIYARKRREYLKSIREGLSE